MWPFKKKQKINPENVAPQQLSYSQVDTTESFNDNLHLQPDEWIETIPLNKMERNPESMGLPPVNANAEEVYSIASKLSRIRESFPVPDDGVYCPICHIANTNLLKLRTPCPKCGRDLLKFGWS